MFKSLTIFFYFQVKKFITKDGVIFPIQVLFERESEGSIKQVRRTLFSLMNPYPQKKIITFNKHTSDFTFNVNYAELEYLPPVEVSYIGSLNVSQVSVKGVEEAFKKHAGENVEYKGIKAHFAMDESGILSLVNVELTVEKAVAGDAEEESPLSKLGSTISKLFGGEGGADEKPVHEEEVPPEQEEKPQENVAQNETKTNQTESTNKTSEADVKKDLKPKIITVKEPIKATEKYLSFDTPSKEQLEESTKKLAKLSEIEREINRRASALNNLESFVIDVQNKLSEDEYSSAVTEEEAEKFRTSCSEVSDWLYDDGADADADTYERRLDALKSLTRDWFGRVFEHRERPEALAALKSMLNGSTQFLDRARNLTKTTNPDRDVFTDVEIETLESLILETTEWRDKLMEEQKKLKNYEAVKLTVKGISEKMAALDREVKYLVNKLKLWRPKKVETPKEENVETPGDNAEEEKVETRQEDPRDYEEAEANPSETKEEDENHTEL